MILKLFGDHVQTAEKDDAVIHLNGYRFLGF